MKPARAKSTVIVSLTLEELCRFCHADRNWVIELVEHGVLEPEGASIQNWRFHSISIARAKKARRLNRDLGVNAAGIALVLDLLAERDEMLRRLASFEDV
ncbi:chaperone modulator CbpM [Leisingera aquaemixtae]|uniref:chaperone modulator CbpM n=1 Tax=Leisingera aquaemixtae TaxID=1396826 RepID=UPI001C981A1E|nr:chaperone modulator CbpM [Leisingera aquaemixtae]MBY6068840.1 chaperone modulator CbpM [Leisingera aquaemixtae]